MPLVKLTASVVFSLQKQNPSFTYELIVVDDGSKDKTTEVIILNIFSEYVIRNFIFAQLSRNMVCV